MARNRKVANNAASALDAMKMEVASELGIPLNQMDNGDLTTRQVGQIGGAMTRKLVEYAENALKNQPASSFINSGAGSAVIKEVGQRNQPQS